MMMRLTKKNIIQMNKDNQIHIIHNTVKNLHTIVRTTIIIPINQVGAIRILMSLNTSTTIERQMIQYKLNLIRESLANQKSNQV